MLNRRVRVFYGLGGGVYAVKEAAYSIFILLFYTQVLGLRLVKQTVNFDDPGSYHLYFGDQLGRPGDGRRSGR